jgi:predicted permease
MLASLVHDIRYVTRALLRQPGFAAAAIAPLALGVGLNTGVFSILNNVIHRQLPSPDAHQLLSVYQDFRGGPKRRVHGARSMFSLPEYRAYRHATTSLAGVAAYTKPWTVSFGGRLAEEAEGVLVTCTFFDVLRLRPVVGTGFTPANCEAPGAAPSVVLSHALWTRAFAADPGLIGRSVVMNGQDVVVVGVAPPGFDGIELARSAFFASTTLQPMLSAESNYLEDPHVSWLTLLVRRREATSIDRVRAELSVIAGRIDRQQPGRTTSLLIAPSTSLSLPVARKDFFGVAGIVLAAFGGILLIACANVANVLLARGAVRSQEIAIRRALGAGRWRLVRLLLTESVMVTLVGAVAGSLLAWWSFQSLLPMLLASVPGVSQPRVDAHPDRTVLGFGLTVTILTALACGAVPALRASKAQLHSVMKAQTPFGTDGRGGWLRSGLIAVQVAVCMVLLVCGALLLRALHAASTLDPGFTARDVAVVSVDLRGPRYSDAAVETLRSGLVDQLRSLAGVTAVARAGKVPLSPGRMQASFRLPRQAQADEFDVNAVSPEFFAVLGIPIVSGRTFTAEEQEREARAVVVTEATARRLWPGRNPVGQTIVPAASPASALEVVGVARDAHVSHVAGTASSYLYLPAGPSTQRRLTLLVHSAVEFESLSTAIRGTVRRFDPGLLPRVQPLEANLEYWRRSSRAVAILAAALGLVALLLASVGLYGVVAYLVTRNRREVGIRIALGAAPRAVQRLFLRQMVGPVAVGVVAGAVGAAAASRVLESRLYGISPLDPVAFAGAAVFLTAVATAATLVPTRRALEVDPVAVLRDR